MVNLLAAVEKKKKKIVRVEDQCLVKERLTVTLSWPRDVEIRLEINDPRQRLSGLRWVYWLDSELENKPWKPLNQT